MRMDLSFVLPSPRLLGFFLGGLRRRLHHLIVFGFLGFMFGYKFFMLGLEFLVQHGFIFWILGFFQLLDVLGECGLVLFEFLFVRLDLLFMSLQFFFLVLAQFACSILMSMVPGLMIRVSSLVLG